MKHRQSQLVSYKVEWLCSLAGFSWWSASPFLCLCLFKCSFLLYFFFFFFAHPYSEEQRKGCGGGPGGEGCIITANYSCVCTHWLPAAALKPADFTASALFHGRTRHYLQLLLLCYYIYSFSYLHPAKKHQFFLFYQAAHKQ